MKRGKKPYRQWVAERAYIPTYAKDDVQRLAKILKVSVYGLMTEAAAIGLRYMADRAEVEMKVEPLWQLHFNLEDVHIAVRGVPVGAPRELKIRFGAEEMARDMDKLAEELD